MRTTSFALCNAATALGVGQIDILLGQSNGGSVENLAIDGAPRDAATFCYLSGCEMIT